MEQEMGMANESEMIWDELELGERIELFRIVQPSTSMAKTMNRVFRHIEQNIAQYQHLIGH